MRTLKGDANLFNEKDSNINIENLDQASKIQPVRPLIKVKILNHEFPAFLDTGSSLSVVGDAVIKVINEQGIKCRNVSREIQFLKGTCQATRSVNLKVDFGEGVSKQNLMLMPGAIETVLLGRDFLGPNMIGVNIGLSGWTFGKKSKILPFIPGPKRFLLHSDEIPTSLNIGCPSEIKPISKINVLDASDVTDELMVLDTFTCPAQALANWDYEPDLEEEKEEIPEVPLLQIPSNDFEISEELMAPSYLSDSQRNQLEKVIKKFSHLFTKTPGLCKLY